MATTNRSSTAQTSSGVWVLLPLIVLLAYTAFLLTGFGRGLGALQPVPVYLFFCLVLLTLQQSITMTRSFWRLLYVLLTSAFAVAYAGEFVFNMHTLDLTRNPATYVIGEAVLLAAFIVDRVGRPRRRALRMLAQPTATVDTPQGLLARFGGLATDFASVAAFFFGTAFLLDLLGDHVVPHALGIHLGAPYVIVNLNSMFHLTWGSPMDLLDGLNLVLGLAAAVVSLALLVVAGALPAVANDAGRDAAQRTFWQTLRDTLAQIIGSLRLVLTPLIWLIPAFALAKFAQQTAEYFNLAARTPSGIADLFNPFSPTGVRYWETGVGTFLLGLVAVAAMIVAVMVIEQEAAILRRTLHAFHLAGRSVALTLAFFMYSLAGINALAVLLGTTKEEPFQVGAPGLIALVIWLVMLVYDAQRLEAQPQRQVSAETPPPATTYEDQRELSHR